MTKTAMEIARRAWERLPNVVRESVREFVSYANDAETLYRNLLGLARTEEAAIVCRDRAFKERTIRGYFMALEDIGMLSHDENHIMYFDIIDNIRINQNLPEWMEG